jgi:hypothetical protein
MNIRQTLRGALAVLIALQFAGEAHASAALQTLSQARLASGGDGWLHVAGLRLQGTDSYGGLSGPGSVLEDTRTGKFVRSLDFGVYRTAEGFDGSRLWRQGRSGGVHPLDGAFAQSNARTESWLVRRDYFTPNAGQASLTGPVERVADGRVFDVISAKPPGGQPVELWFDRDTHLLAKTVRAWPTTMVVERFDDYRPALGVKLPFRIVRTDDEGQDEDRFVAQQYASAATPAEAFTLPPIPRDTHLTGPTRVAVDTNGFVTLEAWLNDVGPLQFLLDTGGHDILTPATAERLGLHPVGSGESGGSGEGKLLESAVRVRTVRIGDATFDDQYFSVIPLQYSTVERGATPALAGIIGLELFERLTVRIDYDARTLTLSPPQIAQRCEGTSVRIAFDDDIPLATGAIDGFPGVIAIDTGNTGSTIVQGIWAQQVGLAERLRHGLPMMSFGAGGGSTNWLSRGHTVDLGGAQVKSTDVRLAQDRKGAFASRTEAANVGRYFLAGFAATFDYARSRLCLESRSEFALPAFDRSGLTASKQEPDAFTIVRIQPGSAAAAATLREGDRIVAINGRPATELGGRDLFDLVRAAPGTRLKLTVARGSDRLDVPLVLQDPVLEE